MNKFLIELKKFMLTDEDIREVKQLAGYYETIVQSLDDLKILIDDCNTYDFGFYYAEDDTEGYTQGKICVDLYEKTDEDEHYSWREQASYCYEILLGYDDRFWGYCECTPNDNNYNSKYRCCGNGCDWSAPQVRIQKVETICYKSFDGIERGVWELEKAWDKDEQLTQEEIEHQDKLSQIKSLEDQIAALTNKKEELHKELNK